MLPLSKLIEDLTEATVQMKQAALGEDWVMVGRLQRQRAALVERIQEAVQANPLTPEHVEILRSIRKDEAGIWARAKVQKQTLGKALEQLESGAHKEPQSRMQKAYGAAKPKG